MQRSTFLTLILLLTLQAFSHAAIAQPARTLDLAGVFPGDDRLFRLFGSVGQGDWGIPVAGGFDMDGDLKPDFAMAAFTASPLSRSAAGQVFLVFGDDTLGGSIDTKNQNSRVLRIYGDQTQEHAGSEIWMADVTGDGLGDLLICRQDFTPASPNRLGGGALTIIPGQAVLRTMATNDTVLDLRNPPNDVEIVTILGATPGSRFCIWARTGDVTGDGIDDFVVGADREASHSDSDSGAAYVFRGGDHLESSQTIDLANIDTVIPNKVARILPRDGSTNYHFGATVQIADLDGNGKAEVLIAAALNRAGAALGPVGVSGESQGGSPNGGEVFIAWDDNFTADWNPTLSSALDFTIDEGPGSYSSIHGISNQNHVFGEEMLAGLDYDDDGNADLFVGDLTADTWGGTTRTNAGTGHVIYHAALLKGEDFNLGDVNLPTGFSMATFLGPSAGGIGGDTAMHGDFNGDGIDDLAFSSPHDNPMGRIHAGTMHIILGRPGKWPVFSDLNPGNYPASNTISILEIYGANGSSGSDAGDTLSYSGAFADMNGDGVTDIITNEMLGNSTTLIDSGNLLLLDIRAILDTGDIFKDGFESP